MEKPQFHQERIINGILHHRESARQSWVPYSAEELTSKIEEVQLAAQREITESTKESEKSLKDALKQKVSSVLEEERKRVQAIIEGEEELQMDLTSEQLAILEQMNRVELARVVVKVTKKALIEKVRGI